ncbi:hypothetical protein GGX14DRAFT_404188 [Mycena pura]|uniref:Uncharacterized protein n=1 Tax=Mycena pura TaxID=153505 RepID=A0AAD6UV25_9AGAR|nr:hypothetical protein GGX14DRAFT_404188 [Mycena pura]
MYMNWVHEPNVREKGFTGILLGIADGSWDASWSGGGINNLKLSSVNLEQKRRPDEEEEKKEDNRTAAANDNSCTAAEAPLPYSWFLKQRSNRRRKTSRAFIDGGSGTGRWLNADTPAARL